MHGFIVAFGVLLILMIVVHIVFRIIKFTIIVFLLGVALIGVIYVFHAYLGIDLLSIISSGAAST